MNDISHMTLLEIEAEIDELNKKRQEYVEDGRDSYDIYSRIRDLEMALDDF